MNNANSNNKELQFASSNDSLMTMHQASASNLTPRLVQQSQPTLAPLIPIASQINLQFQMQPQQMQNQMQPIQTVQYMIANPSMIQQTVQISQQQQQNIHQPLMNQNQQQQIAQNQQLNPQNQPIRFHNQMRGM